MKTFFSFFERGGRLFCYLRPPAAFRINKFTPWKVLHSVLVSAVMGGRGQFSGAFVCGEQRAKNEFTAAAGDSERGGADGVEATPSWCAGGQEGRMCCV